MAGIKSFKKEGNMRKNLKEARKMAGMTQQEVAKKLNISLRYYRCIENGERNGDFTIWD